MSAIETVCALIYVPADGVNDGGFAADFAIVIVADTTGLGLYPGATASAEIVTEPLLIVTGWL